MYGNTLTSTTNIEQTTIIDRYIYFYINDVNVRNRYFQYNGILSNINPLLIDSTCYIDQIFFYTSDTYNDATIYVYNDNIKIYEIISNNSKEIFLDNINIFLDINSKINIIIINSIGCNYPMLNLKLRFTE